LDHAPGLEMYEKTFGALFYSWKNYRKILGKLIVLDFWPF